MTDSETAAKLAAVNVRVLDGANENRTAVTGADGAYQMYDLQPGTFTVRFSKPGYITVDRVFALLGDRFNDLSVTMTRSP